MFLRFLAAFAEWLPPKPQNLLSYIVYYLSLITGGIQHVREEREVRAPYFWEAIVSFLGLIIVMSIGIVVFEVDPHIPMFIGVIIAALMSLRLGYKWAAIEEMMITGISRAMQAVLILAIVGMMVGVWLLSGTIPTMIYYGLKLLSPSIFLVAIDENKKHSKKYIMKRSKGLKSPFSVSFRLSFDNPTVVPMIALKKQYKVWYDILI